MSQPIRAFIAVKIAAPRALRSMISTLGTMGGSVKAVSDDALHVTLKFLGDTDPGQISEIARIVQAVSEPHSALEVRLVGLGAFPGVHRPSVVWAGLENAETLVVIANALETALEPLGFSRERRPFRPHLTLARIRSKPPAELGTLLRDQATREFGTAKIDAVELIQSELGPRGSRYTMLATVALPSAAGR
jgi:2'-5' RNA ligase